MAGKRKGRLKDFQRKTDNADLEKQRENRKKKMDSRKQEIETKRKRKDPSARRRYMLNRTRVIKIAVILIVVVFLGVWTYKIASETTEYYDSKEKNEQLIKEKEEKEEELKNSGTDDYREKKARDQLKMVKPGEKLFVLDKNKNSNESKSEDK